MAWKLEIYYSDGESELVDEDFNSEQEAEEYYEQAHENWSAGREWLKMAGREYSDAEIEDCDIWEE